jgi:DNA polymerase-4
VFETDLSDGHPEKLEPPRHTRPQLAGGAVCMSYIVYVDMDAYYVSCEVRDRPELEGQPVIVGRRPTGPDSRGVVLSASYEARRFGVRSALPVVLADRRCPQAIWVAPDFEKYGRVAEMIRTLLKRWSERVVPMSIDEAALQVNLSDRAAVGARAREIQSALRTELRLPSSIGGSPFVAVAKIASDAAKPGGIRVVTPEETESFLEPLPVRALPGIGPKTAERLERAGVTTVGGLARASSETLRRLLGRYGEALAELARGRPGPSLADLPTDRGPRQRSLDRTFEHDAARWEELRGDLEEMAQELSGILSQEGLRYQQVVVRMRWADFTQLQRGQLLPAATEGADPMVAAGLHLARELWEREQAGRRRPVRRLSLAAGRLLPRRGRQERLDAFAAA